MCTETLIRLMAGTITTVGLGLYAWTGAPVWLILPAFVGINLFQSSLTGFCPAETIFRKLGVGPCRHP